jgi:transcriptional regulator with XRE-family HTH domain
MKLTLRNVGSVVRELREEAGLSQKELGAKSRVGQPMISRIESGEKNPSIGTLVHIVRVLGYSLEVLRKE